MQNLQWTTELILIASLLAVVLFMLGIFISMLLHNRRTSQLKEQLQLSQDRIQELALTEGQLQAELFSTKEKEAKLLTEQGELKQNYQQLTSKLEAQQLATHQSEKACEALAVTEQQLRQQLAESKQVLSHTETKYENVQAQLNTLQSDYAKLETAQNEREASHAREVETFEKQKASLSEQFKALSNDILEAKSKALHENSRSTLSSVITPFQHTIDGFKKEVQEIHHRESTQRGELRKELESLKELNQKMTTEAHELSTALRGQKKLQGNWGELVLENVLDRSGLQLGKDYEREVSITTEHGRQRPDAIVHLPQARHLVIDAKVSLNAYTRFVNAEDDVTRVQALKEHVQAVASRIKELADKDYYKLPGLNSPEMVFMFIPIESAFVEALKADETLFQQAIENNVLVATPTTLLTSLNIVRQLWRYEDQNKHTVALARKADAVFKKLNTFLLSFEKIKKGIENASDAYIKAENQLVSGKGNLVKQVGEFKKFAPAIKSELPDYYTEKAELEIDLKPTEEANDSVTQDDNNIDKV